MTTAYENPQIQKNLQEEILSILSESIERNRNVSTARGPWLSFQPIASNVELSRESLIYCFIQKSEDAYLFRQSFGASVDNLRDCIFDLFSDAAKAFFFEKLSESGAYETLLRQDVNSVPVMELLTKNQQLKIIFSGEAQQGVWMNPIHTEKVKEWKNIRDHFIVDNKSDRFQQEGEKLTQTPFYTTKEGKQVVNPDYLIATHESLAIFDPDAFGVNECSISALDVEELEKGWKVTASLKLVLAFDPSKEARAYRFARCLHSLENTEQ